MIPVLSALAANKYDNVADVAVTGDDPSLGYPTMLYEFALDPAVQIKLTPEALP